MAIGHKVAAAKAAKEQADEPTVMSDEAADQLIAEIEAAATPAPQATFTMDQVMALLQTAKSGGETDIEGLLTKVLSASAKANASAMQTALNRENPNYVAKGPYHRADGSEVRAKYDVFFGPSHSKGKGGRLPKDMWREEEADLINRFQVGDHRTSRNGDWSAECVRDGSTYELIVKVPMFTEDQRNDLPSFAMILRELLDGEQAVNPETLAAEVAKLKQQIAALSAA